LRLCTDFEKRDQERRDAPSIVLPHQHPEFISHIAIDIGGSLIKLVYFSPEDTTADGVIENGRTRNQGGRITFPEDMRLNQAVVQCRIVLVGASFSDSMLARRVFPMSFLGCAGRQCRFSIEMKPFSLFYRSTDTGVALMDDSKRVCMQAKCTL
jgi:hypothetical protein